MLRIVPGQRWMSEAEPELGLGTVVAADEIRRYAVKTAPLRRVRFGSGDVVSDVDGRLLRIESVAEVEGLLVYSSAAGDIVESSLSDRLTLSGPIERLLAARVDEPAAFELRAQCLRVQHRTRSSDVRGFVGPRIELLPHQFFIAAEIAARFAPRVLLADETGLGKTVEAGLAIHRLLLTGRATRVLILVPDSLVHQWLVELRRRFQLRFAVFDAERCDAIESDDAGTNPFASEQLVLAGVGWLASDERRIAQALDAGWDVLAIDEAHHLVCKHDWVSPEYRAVERLAGCCEGLLLISATPEQLGEEGHFARLRLLDPLRYDSLERWRDEGEHYREAARIGGLLDRGEPLHRRAQELLARIAGLPATDVARALAGGAGRARLLADLIDRHGPGRVMFRNTHAVLGDMPSRRVRLHSLTGELTASSQSNAEAIAIELAADLDTSVADGEPDLRADPRLRWIVQRLQDGPHHKLLVICRSASKAHAIKAAVEGAIHVDVTTFHEGLSLLQRDRNAAWFADPDGARLMVCSEIGSEGRNFQHVQDLVMFDLPLDPDLVEQRIGRLDRIGQRGDVNVHVLYRPATGQEVLARWHHEGAASFERGSSTALALLERFGGRVRELALGRSHEPASSAAVEGGRDGGRELDELIAEAASFRADLAARIAAGRDRLLELASLRPAVAESLISQVRACDADGELEDFFVRLLEHFQLYAEEIATRTYLLNPDALCSVDFPTLERGQSTVTFDRELALVREDLELVTADHPLLEDAMDLLAGSEAGNAVFVRMDADEPPSLFLETFHLLETVAPRRLHVDRFLAPTPVRVVVDQKLADLSDDADLADALRGLPAARARWLAKHRALLRGLLERMGAAAEQAAERRATGIRARAVQAIHASVGREIERLEMLARANPHVRAEEVEGLRREREELERFVAEARLRLDSARLVYRGPRSE